jgi:PAS domain S-box-containing protein
MKAARSKTRKPGTTPKHPERSQALEKLEYREQRYRSIAESTPDGMVTIDADGNIVLWNRAAEKIFGYTAEEMLGKPLTRIMPKRFHEAHKNSLNRVASGGKPRIIGKTVEVIGLRKDKSEFPLELSMAKWKTGEGLFFTAVIRDITERKQAEEALKDSEEKFRSLVESTSDWIWEINRDGVYTYASPKVKELLGYEPEEVIGKTPFDFMPAEEAKRVANKFKDTIKNNKPIEKLENINLHKDGHLVILETSGVPVFDGNGHLRGYRGVDRDITERKQAEEALQQSQERYQNLVENINDVIFEVDTEGNITYISPAIERIGKYKADELIGQNFSRFVHPDDMPGLISSFHRVLAGILKPFEFRVLDKDGSIRYARTNSRQRMQHGQVIGITGVLSDITDRKKMLDSLTITDRLAALGNMAGGFAHELNNPLTSVIGYAQLLLDRKDLSEDVRSDLTGIYEEAQRASEVIKNFMVFALKRPLQKQPYDINSFIQDVLKLRQHEQRNNNIKVKTNLDPQLPLVMAGPTRMRQVFLDIITNAEYFMFQAHKKGTLTITTESKGDVITASFTDDGPGIPPENLGQIFNPFFTTKEVGQGIGLGLSICHSIVTEHGGNIYVESEPGKGATFIVELPIIKD